MKTFPTPRHPDIPTSQTGAMFGLDARIALAIFGILSIVAGVTAFNVMSEAGTTAQITEFSNIKKAFTEFQLTIGELPAKYSDLYNNDSGYPGWKQPFMDVVTDKSRNFGSYSFVEGRQDVPGVPPVECTGGGICSAWLKLTKVKDSVAKEIDKSLDTDDSPNSGTFRIEFVPGPTDDVYYLLTAKGTSDATTPASSQ